MLLCSSMERMLISFVTSRRSFSESEFRSTSFHTTRELSYGDASGREIKHLHGLRWRPMERIHIYRQENESRVEDLLYDTVWNTIQIWMKLPHNHLLIWHVAFILQAGMSRYPKGTFGRVHERLELNTFSRWRRFLHNVSTFKMNTLNMSTDHCRLWVQGMRKCTPNLSSLWNFSHWALETENNAQFTWPGAWPAINLNDHSR